MDQCYIILWAFVLCEYFLAGLPVHVKNPAIWNRNIGRKACFLKRKFIASNREYTTKHVATRALLPTSVPRPSTICTQYSRDSTNDLTTVWVSPSGLLYIFNHKSSYSPFHKVFIVLLDQMKILIKIDENYLFITNILIVFYPTCGFIFTKK